MDLQKAVRILRAYWIVILLTAVAGGAVGWGWSALQPRVYTATATGYVTATQSDGSTGAALAGDQLAKSKVLSFVDMGGWRSVAETAKADLGLPGSVESLSDRVQVTHPVETATLRAEASGPTPESARDLAEAWIRALTTEIDRVESGSSGEPAVRLVAGDSARVPSAPASPNVNLAILAGAAAGLLSGVVFAFVRRAFDRRLRSDRDVEERVGVAVIGTLPLDRELAGERRVFSYDDTADDHRSFAHKEAVRELRTNLQYVDVDHPARVIVMTSPLPGDGKSTTAANLAVSMAAAGQSVMLIDADLRRPVLGGLFGVSDEVGLSDVLAGRALIQQVAHRVGDSGRLFVVAAGRTPPNPSEMVGSQRMQNLAREVGEEMMVIIDSPPTLAVADAAVIASWADGAVIVASAGRTTDDMLARAIENVAKTKGRLLGVVLNRVSRRGGESNGARYAAYYGIREEKLSWMRRLLAPRSRRRGRGSGGAARPGGRAGRARRA